MIVVEFKRDMNFFLKSSGKFSEHRKVEINGKTEVKEKIEKFIFCKLCMNKITLNSEKIFVDGNFSFEFVNPADIKYMIGCFSNAQGCFIQGIPTYEDTWFPCYAWRFVKCKQCGEHLGWYFQRKDDGFFGLILTKLEGDL